MAEKRQKVSASTDDIPPEYNGDFFRASNQAFYKGELSPLRRDIIDVREKGFGSKVNIVTDIQKNFNDIKEFFGTGFKQNLYTVNISFNKAKKLKDSLKQYLTSNANHWADESNGINTSSDSLIWNGICTKVRIPSSDITDVNPYGNYRTPITKSKENLTLSFIEDQWASNSSFWRFLNLFAVNENTGKLAYRDDYEIDKIEVTLYSPYHSQVYTFAFNSCFAKTTPEMNLDSTQSALVTFDITIGYENYVVTRVLGDQATELTNQRTKISDIFDKFNYDRKNAPDGQAEAYIEPSSSGKTTISTPRPSSLGAIVVDRFAPGLVATLSNPKELKVIAGIVAANAVKNLGALGINALGKTLTANGINLADASPGRLVSKAVSAIIGETPSEPKEVITDLVSEATRGPAQASKAEAPDLNSKVLKIGRIEISKPK